MKQNMRKRSPLAVLLALCLAMQLCVPAAMASNRLMRAGDAAIAQIEEEEGFRAEKYSSGGKWYIGYGTECGAEDYPEGITREEAELLLMSKVEAYEAKLNDFFDRYDVTPTQGQFDALICFSYNFGTGWMSGTSDLVKIARGEKDATRLEVAHAFGEWCHSGGQAQAGLADRRLQEAAIYLDDSTRAAENEFAYLIIYMESGTSYETDFAVYEIGKTYGSFPKAEKLGYGDEADFWEIVGLLHDLDFEMYPDEHCIKSQEIMRENGLDERLIRATASHGYGLHFDGLPEPQHEMEKILFATDELTGLIGAVALMRPSKSVSDLEVKSVKKKYKDKKFAAGCSREVIERGAEMLGWDLDTLIEQTILAMRASIHVE